MGTEGSGRSPSKLASQLPKRLHGRVQSVRRATAEDLVHQLVSKMPSEAFYAEHIVLALGLNPKHLHNLVDKDK